MQEVNMIKKFGKDNKGNFTVEATFIMLIIIGVILAVLYVALYCTDCSILNSKLKKQVRKENINGTVNGLLGEGNITKTSEWGIWCSTYEIKYHVGMELGFIEKYLDKGFFEGAACVTICQKDACEFIRMYEALRNKG